MSYLDKSALRLVGTRPIRPDGVDKGHRPRQFRRRHDDARHAVGPRQAQPPCACPDRRDQHREGIGSAGVKAVVTRADFPDVPPERAHIGAAPHNLRDCR